MPISCRLCRSALIAVVPSPGVRVTVAESLRRDLVKVSEWCDLWGMKLNASKTKTMIVSRSRTMHPLSRALTIGSTVQKESDDLVILRVTSAYKITFEKHLRSISRADSQRLGILTKSRQLFHDRLLLGRCFRGFVLPVLEYCSAVRCSAADAHLKLLDRVVSCVSFLTEGVFECDRAHRRSLARLCMLYKIRCNPIHPHYGALPEPYVSGECYTQCSDRASVDLCASSLQNFAAPQDFYSLVSISVGQSW